MAFKSLDYVNVYYCIDRESKRQYLFVPFTVFSFKDEGLEARIREDPNFLSRITLALSNGDLTANTLKFRTKNRGLEVHTKIRIPKQYVHKLNRLFPDNQDRPKSEQAILVDEIFSYINRNNDFQENHERDIEENDDDIEDFKDRWWNRGEEPPYKTFS